MIKLSSFYQQHLMPHLPEALTPYFHTYIHNESVIEQVKEWKLHGFKVNVFIGKTPSVSDTAPNFPKVKGQEKWVSLSIDLPDSDYYSNPERFHLVLDCNHTEQMKLIKGLFDLAVVDLSVTKFFRNSALLSIANSVAKDGILVMPELASIFGSCKPTEDGIGYFCVQSSMEENMIHCENLRNFKLGYFKHQLNQETSPSLDADTQIDALTKQNADSILKSERYLNWELEQEEFFPLLFPPEQKIHLFLEFLAKEEQGIVMPWKAKVPKAHAKAKQDLSELFKKVEFCEDDLYWSEKTHYLKAEAKLD